MDIYKGKVNFSTHQFGGRMDLTYRSTMNIYKKAAERSHSYNRMVERMEKSFGDKNPESTIIRSQYGKILHINIVQYPHVLSRFLETTFLYRNTVAGISKKRNAPALIAAVCDNDEAALDAKIALAYLGWGCDGECISELHLRDLYRGVDKLEYGVEEVVKKLPHLFATDPTVVTSYTDLLPLEYVSRLERELGIFIGSTPLGDFLSSCTKVKETEFATVYKSDRLG